MSNRKLIGRVSATEKYPSSCDDFQFWLSDDAIPSPFDIVRVENKTDDSITYGVVQDILHITDGTGHLSNYVSSDFGNVDTTPMTRRLSLSYAKVSVIHNTRRFTPLMRKPCTVSSRWYAEQATNLRKSQALQYDKAGGEYP